MRTGQLLPTATLALALACAGMAAQQTSDLERRTLTHQGRQREYFVHFPNNRFPPEPKPVVFVLHGGGGAAPQEMARRTGMNALADREDFVVVYPVGIDGQWNDGRGKTFRRAKDNTDVDDVGYMGAVIEALTHAGQADPKRIYVTGLSNGGMMTYRLGIELGDRLAAIAAVIANLPENLSGRRPVRPLPVLIMNGADDPMMPWNGGPVRVLGNEYGMVLSTQRTVRYWVDAAHLPPEPVTRILEDRVKNDGCRVETDEYRSAGNPVEVVLYRIQGGGHNLPGGQTPDRPLLLGRKCMDIDGPEAIWSFFKKHSLAQARPQIKAAVAPWQPAAWHPKVKPVGDPKANYLNVEFTCDGKYMVWFEGSGASSVNGTVWHCGVDPETGELIPPDGRGFRAFESTSWGRANPGCDQQGPYYVGADREGKLISVRPEGPTRGQVRTLPTPPDRRRRAIYPTNSPDRPAGFVLFIQNEKNPGAGVRANNNSWVELKYIDLARPDRVNSVARQNTPPAGFAPMDVGFVRWMRGRPLMTFGAVSQRTGTVTIHAFDADQPAAKPVELIAASHHFIDPYPAVIGSYEYIFAGVDANAASHVYRRPAGASSGSPFELFRVLTPPQSRLASPSLAQSHEPFVFGGRLYTVYQVNERGANFFETTFLKPGEIWLADLSRDSVSQWLIAPEGGGLATEPEPLVGRNRVWVFYNRPMLEESPAARASGESPTSRPTRRLAQRIRQRQALSKAGGRLPRLALYRAEVPLGGQE